MVNKMVSTYARSAKDEFDLDLKIKISEAFAKMADEMVTGAKTMTPLSSGGHVIPRSIRMAHPEWPFGAIVRNPAGRKTMVVGPDPKWSGRFYGVYIVGPDEGEMFSFSRDDYEPDV